MKIYKLPSRPDPNIFRFLIGMSIWRYEKRKYIYINIGFWVFCIEKEKK